MAEKLRIDKQIPTRQRILNVSHALFLEQGYTETGLNQIVSEAATVKASLYQHFKSKEELGKTVLLNYSESNLILLQQLMKRYPIPMDFVEAWIRLLKKKATQNTLYGCPMANFRSQIADGSPVILKAIYEIVNKTIDLISEYLSNAKEGGLISSRSNPKKESRYLFLAYEGVLQVWRLTGDKKVFDDLKDIAEKIFIFQNDLG